MRRENKEERRLRLPKDDEVIGIVEREVGDRRMYVRCMDGKIRLCRVPGRYARSLWVKTGSVVIVKPWELQGDKRGDIIHKYTKTEVLKLKELGYLRE